MYEILLTQLFLDEVFSSPVLFKSTLTVSDAVDIFHYSLRIQVMIRIIVMASMTRELKQLCMMQITNISNF